MRRTLVGVLVGVTAAMVLATAATADNGKISGLVYSDYYYVVANHNADLEDLNGFWFRRVYLTYDKNLDEEFSMRVRMEMGSPGDFTTSATANPFLKDAYLRWKRGRHQVLFGLSSTPTYGHTVEKTWGYRAVEKTPLDLQKFAGSRDFGVALKGKIDADGRMAYHVMLANGSGTKSETDEGKKVMGALALRPRDGVLFEVYGDWTGKDGDNDVFTGQAFAAYTHEKGRVGVLFAHQLRNAPNDADTELQIGSIFGVVEATERVNLLVRVDRMFDPNPSGEKIAYIPFDDTTESTLLIAGADVTAGKNVHLIPNVETVFYDEPEGGTAPDTDVIGRLTAYWKF